ncbi:DUF6344 domain-containing protein [Streptomyces sp. E11-3]|uniref:DUF6344 domain-containing protein n=1 Tax=Streptomyces sp. E11-3 TaxID=3110112 RepID=UPI00397FA05A
MAANKVTRVWSVLVTALLAFFTTLGLITTATAAPAVPQQDTTRNRTDLTTVSTAISAPATAPRPYAPSKPPTMKQRIHAEAHGSSPSVRGTTVGDSHDTAQVNLEATENVPAPSPWLTGTRQ